MIKFYLTESQISWMNMAEIDAELAAIDAELAGWRQRGEVETPIWFRLALANRMRLTDAWEQRTLEY